MGLRESGVVQHTEAMVYAIDNINADPRLLPNVTLGFVILDDCLKPTTALAQVRCILDTTPIHCTLAQINTIVFQCERHTTNMFEQSMIKTVVINTKLLEQPAPINFSKIQIEQANLTIWPNLPNFAIRFWYLKEINLVCRINQFKQIRQACFT